MLMQGKKGLIMGVANDRSIAWGISKILANHGASVALTYQSEPFKKRVEPLAKSIDSEILIQCDVADSNSMKKVFEVIKEKWGDIDFLVHGIGFSNKDELRGKYYNTSAENFNQTMHISCYSFTEACRFAEPLMNNGGSILTLTYYGAEQVMPHYNVMGVAKAALEASVRYLAVDLGEKNIRVNAISAGPMRTIAGAAIANSRKVYKYTKENSPLQRNVQLDELGNTALYFVSDLSKAISGEVHYVDCGFNIIGMPQY